MQLRLIPLLVTAAVMAGCTTLGPDYAGPPHSPAQNTFARAGASAGDTANAVPLDAWWKSFNDPHIDSLVERALKANPSLAATEARLQHARAALGLERANSAPNGSGTALYAHARLPPVDLSSLSGSQSSSSSGSGQSPSATSLNLYSVGFDATWEIDLFGGQRRAVHAAGASLDAAQANLADAQVSLTAEVVQAYVKLRDVQRRLALNDAAVARQQQMLDLSQQRLHGGTMSRLDLVRLQNQLESTRANGFPLKAQADAYLDELAGLLDLVPGALDAELGGDNPVPLPPAQVNTGNPEDMLQRRPDIRAAERQLAARTAQIGQAEAARFPKLTLLGLIGIGGTSPSDLRHLDDYTAVAAPQLSWNFLDFGRAKSRVEEAKADRDEAEAQYRNAIDGALRDAEDALSRYRNGRATVATLARAKAAADEATSLTREKRTAGTASTIDVLDAERQQISAEQGLSQAEAELTTDYISLQKALGLGWRS